MRDQDFAYFIKKFGEANSRTRIPEAVIANWTDKLPPLLLTIWRDEGWASYGEGRFWTVNPEDYEHIKDAWLENTPLADFDNFHVIARTAFGVLYLCGEKTGRSATIACLHNEILALKNKLKVRPLHDHDPSIQALFGASKPADFDYPDSNGKLLFERAVKKYGPLAQDEMYGFEPALVLGGSPTLENLRRLKLDPHLLILRNFDTPTLPFSGVDLEKLMK
ncbi:MULTISPECIES: GAD-like domain-containing protein [Pseudomonas]|uniref:GAD-like domain-containing protein n=1 Tax=Pseudomonas TaxID=286 RepID=UPI0008A4CFC4|nr:MULTISPECIES: GAD-like domain-containing protein [Pseudomonas]OFR55889.1 GAD-like domain protein [Pseudomonas sp. HMSC066A08]RUE55927.1 DUF1851 domain-containing protein [Pseudomonas aeruginosa]HEQ0196601.1 DUF1851 domain-containing protein [Pseudomonas aeruginosa]